MTKPTKPLGSETMRAIKDAKDASSMSGFRGGRLSGFSPSNDKRTKAQRAKVKVTLPRIPSLEKESSDD